MPPAGQAASGHCASPPEAFGFLGENPAPITITGSQLSVPPSETLSIVGGDTKVLGGTLQAPSGRINIASVASRGSIVLAPGDLPVEALNQPGEVQLGNIEVSQGSSVDVSGAGGEGVFIRGGVFTLANGSGINSTIATAGEGGDVSIKATKSIAIVNSSVVGTATSGQGNAGDISISSPTLQIEITISIRRVAYSLYPSQTGTQEI